VGGFSNCETYHLLCLGWSEGYKVYGLAEHGYLWNFSWSSRQLGIEEMFRYPDLTPTGSMVMNLVERLPKSPAGSEAETEVSMELNQLLSEPLKEFYTEKIEESLKEDEEEIPIEPILGFSI
jgi:hypothetical protein